MHARRNSFQPNAIHSNFLLLFFYLGFVPSPLYPLINPPSIPNRTSTRCWMWMQSRHLDTRCRSCRQPRRIGCGLWMIVGVQLESWVWRMCSVFFPGWLIPMIETRRRERRREKEEKKKFVAMSSFLLGCSRSTTCQDEWMDDLHSYVLFFWT